MDAAQEMRLLPTQRHRMASAVGCDEGGAIVHKGEGDGGCAVGVLHHGLDQHLHEVGEVGQETEGTGDESGGGEDGRREMWVRVRLR